MQAILDSSNSPHLAVVVSNVSDLLERLELHNAELVDGWTDVVAVHRVLDLLELPHARDVGQPRLNLCLTGNLDNKIFCTSEVKFGETLVKTFFIKLFFPIN